MKIKFSNIILMSLLIVFQSSFAQESTKIEIKIGHYNLAPYIVQKGDKVEGLCVDMLKKSLGEHYKFKFVKLPWKRSLVNLKSGELDLIACLSKTKEREEHFYFTDKIFNINIYAIALAETISKIQTISDIKRFKGVSLRGDSASNFHNKKTLVIIDNYSGIPKMILTKRAEVALLPEEIYKEEDFKLNPKEKDLLKFKVISSEPIYNAISKKSPLYKDREKINQLFKVGSR